MYDIVVIGGGISGATFAKRAAKKGLKVVVLERKAEKSYKPCAGYINYAARELEPVDKKVIERVADTGKLYTCTGVELKLNINKYPGALVYPSEYHQYLRDLAEENGAEIRYKCEVKKLELKEKYVSVQAGGETIKAKYCVGAFGMNSLLMKFFGKPLPPHIYMLQYEFQMPSKVVDERFGNSVEFYFDSKYASYGYCWVFPKRNGVTVGTYALHLDKKVADKLNNFVFKSEHMKERMKGASPKKFEKRYIFAGIVPTQVLPEIYGRRYVLVGEAAGLTDPLSYHGIYNGIRSARLAAELLSEAISLENPGKLKEYSDAVQEEIYLADIEYGNRIAKTLYGHELADKVADAVIRLAKTDEELRDALANMLHHKGSRAYSFAILKKKKSKIMKRFGIVESLKLSKYFL
ncbi:MAG: NAD(P)/FAD-dependent oxidoreductase [Thermoplasmata archaeon]